MLLSGGPSLALAQPSPSAAALFDEGLAALDRGDLAEACAKLTESQRLEPRVGTLLNLADCEERSGQLVAASDHFSAARDLARGSNDPRVREAKRRLEALDSRLPRLTVRLAEGGPSGAVVVRSRGGETPTAVPASGELERLDPGVYRIAVSAPGYRDRSYALELKPGDRQALTVTVGPAIDDAAGEPSQGAATGGWSTLDTAGVVVGGLGVVSVVVGVIFGTEAIAKQDESAGSCDANNLCDQAGVDLRDEGITAARVSTATIIVGSALIVGGVVLMLVPSEPSEELSPASGAADAPLRRARSVRPTVSLRLAPLGVSAALRW